MNVPQRQFQTRLARLWAVVVLVVLQFPVAWASEPPSLSLASFADGLPVARDGFGNPIGFSTFQDGGGAIELEAVALSPDDPLGLPGHDGIAHALRVDARIAAWGGFAQAFADAALTRWVPLDLSGFAGIRFWYAGTGSGGTVQVDLFDNRNPNSNGDSAERWFHRFTDDGVGWRLVEIPFASFGRRSDFQPAGAPNDGLGLDQASGWAMIFPPGEGTMLIAGVEAYGSSGVVADSTARIEFSEALLRVAEGDAVELIVQLSEALTEAASVRVIVQGESAVALRSFVPVDQLVVFPAGATEASVTLRTLNDGRFAGDLRAVARLDRPRGAVLGFQRRAVVVIEEAQSFDPFLIADFGRGLDRFEGKGTTTLHLREVPAGTAMARPVGARFEGVLSLAWSDEQGSVAATFPSPWDASEADGLEFWFFGDGSGREVLVELSAGRDPDRPWALVWSDEFDGPAGSPPDTAIWTTEIGDGTANGIPGWGNAERQTYTNDPANVAHDGDGHLVIRALETDGNAPLCYYGAACEYTSARITTAGTVEVLYGRIEARLRIPSGQGLWPAFWTLGSNLPSVGWPDSGEIDIMENIGREPYRVHGTIHGPGYSGANGIGGSVLNPSGLRFAEGFHRFAIEWTADRIVWFLDGEPYSTVHPSDLPAGAPWVFDQPQFLILNVAVGGNWPGYPNATTTFPQEMVVDYVRVYQPVDSAARYEARFADLEAGWTRVRLPLDGFERSAQQVEGAVAGFDRSLISGLRFSFGGGAGAAMLDELRWYGGD